MRSTFKTVFYVNGSKEKNGIVPIMGRVTINGTIAQFSCNQAISKDLWDAKANKAKGKSKEALTVNYSQYDYPKVSLDEILWIEADKSYSIIHLTGKRNLTVSFNIAVVKKRLLKPDFLQIHRSYIINLWHVEFLMGNSLKIENIRLTIGREYKNTVFERFIFLGVRRLGK